VVLLSVAVLMAVGRMLAGGTTVLGGEQEPMGPALGGVRGDAYGGPTGAGRSWSRQRCGGAGQWKKSLFH
jgi:hypothetical protein